MMTILVMDPALEERLKQERKAWGADAYDEVWDGVLIMTPYPNNEHQKLLSRLTLILQEILGWSEAGDAFAGVNLSDREADWEQNYRVPDVAVFLRDTRAQDCDTHWRGAADLLIEISSPRDRTREKIPFYSGLGVRELWIVERAPWSLELYQHRSGQLVKVGESQPERGEALASSVLPLTMRLLAGDPRPQIEVIETAGGRRWLV